MTMTPHDDGRMCVAQHAAPDHALLSATGQPSERLGTDSARHGLLNKRLYMGTDQTFANDFSSCAFMAACFT